jgi:hypothetical protein
MDAEVLDLLDEILAMARDVKADMSELKNELDRMVTNLGDGVTPAKAGVQGSPNRISSGPGFPLSRE